MLEFNGVFFSPLWPRIHIIMVFQLFSELKINKSWNAEIVYFLDTTFSVLVKVSLLLTHANCFVSFPFPVDLPCKGALARTKAALFGVFLHHGITQPALISIPCVL